MSIVEQPVGQDTQAAAGPGYFQKTQAPIYSAALILPFAIVYELGIILMRSEFINGGDAIMRTLFGRFFGMAGLHISSVSVIVLFGILIGWQIWKRAPWRVEMPVLTASFFESLLFAVLLFVLLNWLVQYLPGSHCLRAEQQTANTEYTLPAAPQPSADMTGRRGDGVTGRYGRGDTGRRAFPPVPPSPRLPVNAAFACGSATDETSLVSRSCCDAHELVPCARGAARRPTFQDFVLYCGAGVYEELVFRVLLLSLLLLVFTKLFHMEHAYAAVWAVVLGAVIFSGFHHIGSEGDPFLWGRFLQRVFAGLYFSAIYLNRSFGIAAASHALYDVLVGLNLCVFA